MEPSLAVALVLVGAAFIALEFGFSSALTEIIAGMALAYFLSDIGKLEWLEFLANLGLLGLTFMAGFEVDLNRLRETWRASIGIGVLALVVPMTGVFIVSLAYLGLSPQVAGMMAIGLSTTSLALVYHALHDRDMLKTTTGQIILAAATVVDVLSMVALALLLGSVGWGTALFLIVVVPALLGLPRFGSYVFRRYEGSLVEFELRFMLVLLISLGFLAEKVGGIHPAIIAFTIGVLMSEVMEEHEVLEQKLRGIVFSLFAPVFFLHAGMQFDFSLLTPAVLGTAALLFTVACGLKFLGTAFAAKLFVGHSAILMGLLFNYRLSFGLITATVGLKSGVLSSDQYSIILLVVVGSALLPVIFLRDKPNELDEGEAIRSKRLKDEA